MQRRVPLQVFDFGYTAVVQVGFEFLDPGGPWDEGYVESLSDGGEVRSPGDGFGVDEVQSGGGAVAHLGYSFTGVV